MVSSIFEFKAYKKALAYFLLGKEKRGQLSRAAKALNCQPSFLSRVISTETHLTPDQAFMLCKFMNWGAEESEYFQTMVGIERAAEPQYRAALSARAAALRAEHDSLTKRTKKENFPVTAQEALYFSSWHWSAIHFLTSIPEYQTVKSLALRLSLSEEHVLLCLKQLESSGLVRLVKDRWQYAGGQFHLPKQSPFVLLHHQNWRARAVLDAQTFSNESLHYTSVHTLSVRDVARLRELMLKFISESNAIAQPSSPEESVVLTCDLFRT